MAATDYDSPWKEALHHYFADFLALLFPQLHAQIAWSQAVMFLDKELQAVARESGAGRRYADLLVRVQHKSHYPIWLLIHIEVQGGKITTLGLGEFAERMFDYFCRIRDHYPKRLKNQKVRITSLGVLTASHSDQTLLTYTEGEEGQALSYLKFTLPVVHLAQWLDCWDRLEQLAASNPFAVIVMAQLQAQQTREDAEQRLASKTQIMRLLYHYNYSREHVLQLFRLVDWMMALPPELEPAFEQAMITIEQEHKMAFVTSIERLGEQRGMEKGLEKGLAKGLLKGKLAGLREGQATLLQNLLTRKFGTLPSTIQKRIQTAKSIQLETWSLNILDAETLDEVFDK